MTQTATETLDATDEQLARLAQRGCMASFDRLARRFQAPLIHFLQQQVGRHDAEDLAQEALVRAYQALGRFDANRRFAPWLFTIAYRLAVSHHRGAGRAAAQLPETIGGRADDPAEALAGQEERQRLWSVAKEVLSEDQWNTLWFHYAQDLSIRQIARMMKRTSVSVRVLLFRGRRTLMQHAGRIEGSPLPAGLTIQAEDPS